MERELLSQAIRRPVILKIIAAATVALVLAALANASNGAAEDSRGRDPGIRTAGIHFNLQSYDAPNRGKVKLLLEAPNGESMPDSQILLTDAKLKSFATNGVLERVAESPQCVFNYAQRTVSSAGPLFIYSADKQSQLHGLGFWLQLTNSHFIISNEVHIIIRNKSGA